MTLNTLSLDEQLSKADRLWVSGWASTASLLATESRQSVLICLCARFMRFLTRMNEGTNFTCSAYCIRFSCNYSICKKKKKKKKKFVTCFGMQDAHVTQALLTSFIVPISPLLPSNSNFCRICLAGFNIIIWTSSETSCMIHGTAARPLPDYSVPPGNILMVVTMISNRSTADLRITYWFMTKTE